MLIKVVYCPTCQLERLVRRTPCGVWYEYICTVCKSRVGRISRRPDKIV